MKRVFFSTALVLAFITLVFAQTAQTDHQRVDSRPASDRTAADKVDANRSAPTSPGGLPGIRRPFCQKWKDGLKLAEVGKE